MATATYPNTQAHEARESFADIHDHRNDASTPTDFIAKSPNVLRQGSYPSTDTSIVDSVTIFPTDSPTESLTDVPTEPPTHTKSFWAHRLPSTTYNSSVPASSPPTMSDAGEVADSSATTDGIGTWKLVLAILLPLFCIAIGACVFLYCRQRRQRPKKADVEQVGDMLRDLKSSQAEVDAMRHSLHDGLERMKAIEKEADKRDSLWIRDSATADLNPSQPNLHFPPALNSLRSGSIHDPITPTPIGFRSFSPVEPRPLSGNTLQGTLPRAALGLQHTQYSRGRASSYQSAESTETAISYKPPSTIPEESAGNISSSPFDTPGKKSTDRVVAVEAEQDESPSCRGERSLTKRVSVKAKALMRRNSLLSPRAGLSPIRTNPSHPDLVPQPLAVTKHNSVRETSAEGESSLRSRYGIDKTRLRRSASNPPVNHSYLGGSDLATPTILTDKFNTTTLVEDDTGKCEDADTPLAHVELRNYTNTSIQTVQISPVTIINPSPSPLILPPPAIFTPLATQSESGTAATDSPSRSDTRSRILTPPPTVETLCVLQERRDGGNSKSIRPAKGKKNKKSKKQSSFSSAALPASDNDTKNKKNTAKIIRNTPTPPPLPVLPSRIPIAATHRRSLEAGHKIGNSLHQPPSSKNMGARKRSSMSSMRFTPSPIKRRSQFLLGASSFSSPIRGGGRASTLSSSAITSPGKQRLPPSYASSQCLPSVETMESLSSASISSSSSSDDSSSCTGKQDNNRTVPRAQQHVSVKAEQACTTTPQQQTVRPLDTNVTINRGGLNGYRGHARLLSELSATLRLVHEEEDAVSEEALSTAASTRTPAGISS
ncbi:hypothetical protein PG999_006982 [Apiospora kogelbergensis]|uniref:Uncharacterized protein n=1 Tax=Apiospora kogelbergensis TaxID=1337665 RepID=A0AAW0QX34_9PEZI